MSSNRKSFEAIKKLHGLIAVYKPQNVSTSTLMKDVKSRLLSDLNDNYHHGPIKRQFYLVNWKRDRKVIEESVLKPGFLAQNDQRNLTLLFNYLTTEELNDGKSSELDAVQVENFVQLQKNLVDVAFSAENLKHKHDLQPAKLERVSEDGQLAVISLPSLADHPLVKGPFHTTLSIDPVNYLDHFTSGILLLSVSPQPIWQKWMKDNFLKRNHKQVFQVLGQFGLTTDDWTVFGKNRHTCDYSQVEVKWLKRKLVQFTHDHHNAVRKQLKLPVLKSDLEHDENIEQLLLDSRVLQRRMLMLHKVSLTKLSLPHVELKMELQNCTGEFCRRVLHQIAFKQRTFGCARKVTLQKLGPITLEETLVVPQINVETVQDNISQIRLLLMGQIDDDIGYNLIEKSTENNLIETRSQERLIFDVDYVLPN